MFSSMPARTAHRRIELGVPPHLIGEMLRHADGRMAERVYAQRSREAVGRQVTVLLNRAAGRCKTS